ncbi:MAG: hypothetical protein AB8B84_10060 [Granulosicoccus sp.]
MNNSATNSEDADKRKRSWVYSAAMGSMQRSDTAESRVKTVLTCKPLENKNALFVPSDMAELQPRSLNYLQKFAQNNSLTLIEDRRKVQVQPLLEKRIVHSPKLVLGMSMLLKQAGMPGAARSLSEPHRLNPNSPYFSISTLFDMAAFSMPRAKRVKLEPNRMTVKALQGNTQPITAYACNIKTENTTTVLSHFECDNLKAVGYSAGSQYVFHLVLAGGSVNDPQLWADLETLQMTDFRFQLCAGSKPADDYGLFYSTLFLDLAKAPYPWWLDAAQGGGSTAQNDAVNQSSEVA